MVDRIKNENGQDIFVRGTLSGWIIPLDSKTIYTQYGDVFAYGCIGLSIGLIFRALFGKVSLYCHKKEAKKN